MLTRRTTRASKGRVVKEDEESGTDSSPRIGSSYQAKIPPLIRSKTNLMRRKDAIPYWKPTDKCTDEEIDAYVKLAKEQFEYTEEQSLLLLFLLDYDLKKAKDQLRNFRPIQDTFSESEKSMFANVTRVNGTNFQKIHAALPDRPIERLVAYYYELEHVECKISRMDLKKNKYLPTIPAESPVSEASDSSMEMICDLPLGASSIGCINCSASCEYYYTRIKLCRTCYLHWRNTGEHRPLERKKGLDTKPKLPIGMSVDHDSLLQFPRDSMTAFSKEAEKTIVEFKIRNQKLKQDVEMRRKELTKNGGTYLEPSLRSRINHLGLVES